MMLLLATEFSLTLEILSKVLCLLGALWSNGLANNGDLAADVHGDILRIDLVFAGSPAS